jgi:hypothetical protein
MLVFNYLRVHMSLQLRKTTLLIKICLTKPIVKSVWVNISLMDYLFRMVSGKEILCHYCFSALLFRYAVTKVHENTQIGIEWDTSACGLC